MTPEISFFFDLATLHLITDNYIVGSAVETIEIEKLFDDQSVDAVANNLQDYIKSKGIQVNLVVVEDV